MDYEAAREVYFRPPANDARVPAFLTHPSPARALRDACEPIAMHAVWSRTTNEALAKEGLDFFGGYVWGRASALGEPSPGTVVATFGVFEPSLLADTYREARRACPRATLLTVRRDATAASLAAALAGIDVERPVAVLRGVLTACPPVGRPLFAGLRSLPWPEDPYAGLWRACELVREFRGDGHLAVSLAAGLGPVEMNVLTELWLEMPLGSHTVTRGWGGDQVDAAVAALERRGWISGGRLSESGQSARAELEAATDRTMSPLIDALGADADSLASLLGRWSAACVEAGDFPSDPLKRATG